MSRIVDLLIGKQELTPPKLPSHLDPLTEWSDGIWTAVLQRYVSSDGLWTMKAYKTTLIFYSW